MALKRTEQVVHCKQKISIHLIKTIHKMKTKRVSRVRKARYAAYCRWQQDFSEKDPSLLLQEKNEITTNRELPKDNIIERQLCTHKRNKSSSSNNNPISTTNNDSSNCNKAANTGISIKKEGMQQIGQNALDIISKIQTTSPLYVPFLTCLGNGLEADEVIKTFKAPSHLVYISKAISYENALYFLSVFPSSYSSY